MQNTFNPNTVRAFLLVSATMLSAGAAAAPRFLPTQPGDLVAPALAAPPSHVASAGAPNLERQAVAMSWAAQGEIVTAVKPFVGESREYYKEVSADELAAGVDIHTTSPRALVRLQPLSATGTPISPQSVILTSAGGRAYASGSGMELLVTADKMNKAGLPFGDGTSAFRVHPDLGAGTLKLRAAQAGGSQRYLVNVVEPDSRYALTMQTDAPSYLDGQVLTVLPSLVEKDGTRQLQRPLARLAGYVTSPAGRRFPVDFRMGADGRLRAQLKLDAKEAPHPGLWEVHAAGEAVVAGQTVQRSLRVAFAVAVPVARLNGAVAVANEPGSVGMRLGVTVAAAGRYETRALLYGTVAGAMTPLAVAHSAQWLEPGSHNMVLKFTPDLLAGATGPYELRDLTLLDQGRMGVLQRQQRAVAIDDRDLVRTGAQATVAKPPQKLKLPPVNG